MNKYRNYYNENVQDGRLSEVDHGDCGMRSSTKRQDSEFEITMHGKPPQNEEGNERIATLLSEVLTKRDGRSWEVTCGPPTGIEQGVDWEIKDPNGKLWPLQITRVGRTERWQGAANKGVNQRLAASEAAQEIEEAIQRKILAQNSGTILVLSTGQPGVAGFAEVISNFKRAHLPNLSSELQFAEIWLVGYSDQTTTQIWPDDDTG